MFVGCLNPQNYIEKHTISENIESTYFIILCPTDEKIEQRLRARPKEREFDSNESIRPQIEYNQRFRKYKKKVLLFIDNSDMSVEETEERIISFITGLPK